MRSHSTKIEAMKLFVEYGLTRLAWDLNELDEETLNWRITPEANSVKWLLTHISMILNVYFPRAFTNNLSYLPENWFPEYHDNDKLTIETILNDIEKGKNDTLKRFNQLSEGSLEDMLNWYIGEESRETYLMILSSEILHHEGQISSVIGLKKRLEGEPPKIVPPEA
jgi:hypothetical protein